MTRRYESRELVLVSGLPGGGATWLAQEVVRQEQGQERSSEYISVSETVRYKIGELALASSYADKVLAHLHGERSHEPLPPDVISGIVHEAVYYHDSVDTLVIEGFPQDHSQLAELKEMIENSGRYPIGMLNVTSPQDTALRRLALRADERQLTLNQRYAHIDHHSKTSPRIRRLISESGIPIMDIDTDGVEDEDRNNRIVSVTMAQVALKEFRDLRELRQIERDLAA